MPVKSVQGLSTAEGLVTHKPCQCHDKANCHCNHKGKTMTPEEEAAAKQGQANQGPPPPAEGQAPPPAEGAAGAGGEEAPSSDEPPSVQVSKAVYTSLKNLMGNLKAAENTYENPDAKEYFNGAFTEKCNEAMGEIKGLISKLGSGVEDDSEAPPAEGEEGEDPAEAEEEAMKSFLALGQTQDLKLLGYIAPLNALSKAKNLTQEQKLSIGGVLKSIRGLCDEAKQNREQAKAKALSAQVTTLQESYGGLTKTIADLQASMSGLLPR